ncbi:TetR/AcrR family transcriptional regulator [Aestuariispira ectoiniformans]|uniref:TetR/AcrR family transcriptional regulator n=1 Tax=Aestuariispira ectoiniformans TaxID=2775080 RepID=UPI00223B564C|nr:TetR/AcrR family transcriptional regulator [Aestuariispira ectoiniformans]
MAKSKKEMTRDAILDAAGRNFRHHGFDGVGVDGIARGAGVTSGAFYAHLGSKDGAFLNALEQGLEQTISRIPLFQRDHGADWVSAFADYYLGAAHRGNPECVCAMTSMSPDVVRASDEVRTLYQSKMDRIVDLVADGLDGDDPVVRRQRAWALLTGLIGGLTMARAVQVNGNDDMVAEVVSAVKAAAVAAAGPAKSLP